MLGCDKDAVLTHLAFDEDTGGDKKTQTALHGVGWYAQTRPPWTAAACMRRGW